MLACRFDVDSSEEGEMNKEPTINADPPALEKKEVGVEKDPKVRACKGNRKKKRVSLLVERRKTEEREKGEGV